MHILLIGATGQIGYALTWALAKTSHRVSALVRDLHGLDVPESVEVIQRPTFDNAAFAQALAGVDHVIYAVGIPEQFVLNEAIFERINVGLLRRSLNLLPRRVTGFTYISTYEVFEAIDGVIRESHPLAEASGMTSYYRSMVEAYRQVTAFAAGRGLRLVTIHPAAVYGGRDTNRGFTHYIENLLQGRVWEIPFIIPGRFPLVHVESLADATVRALDAEGPFIISDGMMSLGAIARTLRAQTRSWVPPTVPPWVARVGTGVLETVARIIHRPPMMARVQIDFITQGWEPKTDRARRELGWQPLPLERGLEAYLKARDSRADAGVAA